MLPAVCRFLPIFSPMLPRRCFLGPRRFFADADFFHYGLSREMFYLDLLGRCMDIWGAATCLYHSTAIPEILVGSVTQAPYEVVLEGSHFPRQIKKWLNGYWRNRFGLLRQGNDMEWIIMMRVMSSASSPAVAALDWAHTYFLASFILFSGAFGRLTISSRRHKVKELK